MELTGKRDIFPVHVNTKNMNIFVVLPLIVSLESINIELPKRKHQEIISFVEKAKDDFLSNYYKGDQLYITFEEYNSSYESYLFHVSIDFMGAHPITNLKTFNYYDNKYIDLDNYLTDEDYLFFSNEAKRVLIPELEKEEMFIDEMFYEGIKPIKDNYKNIILSEDYYIIFFEHYQIAPYGAGIRSLKVKRWSFYKSF